MVCRFVNDTTFYIEGAYLLYKNFFCFLTTVIAFLSFSGSDNTRSMGETNTARFFQRRTGRLNNGEVSCGIRQSAEDGRTIKLGKPSIPVNGKQISFASVVYAFVLRKVRLKNDFY